jgi:hypothetical protein
MLHCPWFIVEEGSVASKAQGFQTFELVYGTPL